MLQVLGHDWHGHLADLIRSAGNDLLISSPYVTTHGTDFLLSHLPSPGERQVNVHVLTDLSPNNICQGSTDPAAIDSLASAMQPVRVTHLPRLHAKVYLADRTRAIVTSGNLTSGGLRLNHEYGVMIDNAQVVRRIQRDVSAYADLGAPVDHDQLVKYSEIAQRVRSVYLDQQSSIARAARRAFEKAFIEAEDELIRFRLAGGAMHTVFGRTILYLLRRYGPMATPAIHQRIEAIHPDLCDNTVDRVIDGKRFGKKWKHAVRTGQQQLKQQGLIELQPTGDWSLRG